MSTLMGSDGRAALPIPTAPEPGLPSGAYRKLLRRASVGLFCLSLVWTVVAWLDGAFRPHLHVALVGGLAVGIGISEAAFVGGLGLMASAIPGAVPRVAGHRPIARVRVLRRDGGRALLAACAERRRWRVGFLLNWAGAVATTVLLITCLMLYTPPSAWGGLLVLIFDLVATFGLRLPIWAHRSDIGGAAP